MNLLISICMLLATTTGGAGEDVKNDTLTAYDVLARIKGEVTCNWSEETVDTFKSGNPSDQVTGIACTFMATVDVLKKAAENGCNLIITHEPTYYNHLDSRDKLANDPVFAAKQEILFISEGKLFRQLVSPNQVCMGYLKRGLV